MRIVKFHTFKKPFHSGLRQTFLRITEFILIFMYARNLGFHAGHLTPKINKNIIVLTYKLQDGETYLKIKKTIHFKQTAQMWKRST